MVLCTGYKIGRKLDINGGGYIFDFIDDKIHECIGSVFKEDVVDNSYKIFKIEINVENELNITEIISSEKLISEYLKSYNSNLLEFILNAKDVSKEHIKALIIR